MPTKHKPNKGMKKRFRVTATGKLKHNHMFTSHLRSARSAKRKRNLRRPDILAEGHSINMRRNMGISKKRPNKIAHERHLAAAAKAAGKTETEAK
jgi:large subunit ribosomal protein L35